MTITFAISLWAVENYNNITAHCFLKNFLKLESAFLGKVQLCNQPLH